MTHALSRLTRAHVTVAISGDGGDELFGGYPRFRDVETRFPRRPGQALLRRWVEAGWLPGALLRRTLHGRERVFYRRVETGPWPVSRKSLKHYLAHEAWARCAPEHTLELWLELALSFGGTLDTAGLMRADLWTYLSENCLVKTDRASMAHGLEMRVPMLGNPVLAAVLRLPASAHFEPEGKALLRALARRYLPESVWNRPKHGFSVPLRRIVQRRLARHGRKRHRSVRGNRAVSRRAARGRAVERRASSSRLAAPRLYVHRAPAVARPPPAERLTRPNRALQV